MICPPTRFSFIPSVFLHHLFPSSPLSLYSPVLWEPLRKSFSVVGFIRQEVLTSLLQLCGAFPQSDLKESLHSEKPYVHIRLSCHDQKTAGFSDGSLVFSVPKLFVFLLVFVLYNLDCQCGKSWNSPFSF